MHGLLAVSRQMWTTGYPQDKSLNISTVKYIEELRSRIDMALRAAGENVKEAQARMKEIYDRKSTVREL